MVVKNRMTDGRVAHYSFAYSSASLGTIFQVHNRIMGPICTISHGTQSGFPSLARRNPEDHTRAAGMTALITGNSNDRSSVFTSS